MIASLRGTIVALGAATVHLDVGGVGYLVHVTPTHALELRAGQELRLVTHLVVREDAFTLYGFRDADELGVFEHLISVSGVGPKSALGVLAQLSPTDVANAVEREDLAAFKRVSGIGPKSAGLIIVSLRGKLRAASLSADAPDTGADALPLALRADVVEALVGLGYAEKAAAPIVDDAVTALGEGEHAVADVLRAALRLLGPAKGTGRR